MTNVNVQNDICHKLKTMEFLISEYEKKPIGQGISTYRSLINSMEEVKDFPNKRYVKVDLITRNKKSLPMNTALEIEEVINYLITIAPKGIKNDGYLAYLEQFLEKYGEYSVVPIKDLLDIDKGLGIPEFLFSKDVQSYSGSEFDKFVVYFRNIIIECIKKSYTWRK